MSKPKVRRGWIDHPTGRDESSLMFAVDYPDHAAATWNRKDGRVFWCTCTATEGPERYSNIDDGICDTIEQAKAAAEASLLAAGYEFEEG